MKVAIVIDNLVKGGKERRLIELLNGFNPDHLLDIKLILLKNKIDYPEVFKLQNVKVVILERRIKKDPRVFTQLYKICKEFKPDIIHSWGSMPSIYALPIAKILHVKFINAMISNAVCERGSKSWVRSKLTFPFSDVIVSNSKAGLVTHNAPMNKSKVIHNGFNFDRTLTIVAEEEIRGKFKIETQYVVGMVGAFHDRKDYVTIIKAAMIVLEKRQDVTFLLVGDGPNLEKVTIMVDHKFRNKIKFLGQQNDVESIINIFHIGVLTTNYKVHKEGVSNSIMEYMAFAKPVIASDGGGTNEIIVDGLTGFIVEPANEQQLADKIIYLIQHPEEAEEMGRSGKQRVLDDFGIEKMVESTLGLYRSILV